MIMIGDFELLREAAAALVAIPPDRRTDCFIELLRVLNVRRDVLRSIVDNDAFWPQRPPGAAPEEAALKRTEIGTIFF
jgi:hypothetical protein